MKSKNVKVFSVFSVCLIFMIIALCLIMASCPFPIEPKSTIVFSPGDGGSSPPPPKNPEIGGLLELPDQGGMRHSGGKVLSGWKNEAGETYSIGAFYPVTKKETLTAQWRDPTATLYTVLFEQGEGSGTPPAYKEVTTGTIITLPRRGSMAAPSGKEFDGWKSGGSSLMKADAPYKVNGNITFVAQWKAAANSPTVTSVTVSPTTASVAKGSTRSFIATVAGTNSPSQNVTWTIDESGIHSGTSISTSGRLTVSASETSSKITVRATSKADTTQSGTATVTVTSTAPTPTDSTVTDVTVTPATISIEKGTTQSFSATVAGTNNPSQDVTWKIDESGIHSGTTITVSGLLTVSASETSSKITVRATSKADTTKSGTATVTVTDVAPTPTDSTVTDVTVTPATISIEKGTTQSFSATVAGTNNPSQDVTWKIDESGIHSGTTITESGLLTVSVSETSSKITVRATSTVDTSKDGTATVTLSDPTSSITDVTVTPVTASVVRGKTQSFGFTVIGTGDPAQTVTWSIPTSGKNSETKIENGYLQVSASETLSTLTVRATSTVDTSKYGEATVNIFALEAPVITAKAEQGMRIRVTWPPVTGATGYDVYYEIVPSVGKTLVTNNRSDLFYLHTMLTSGTTYRYYVKAKNSSGGESDYSLPAMATASRNGD